MIRCAIVDDEPYARKGLERYCNQVPYLNLVGVFNSALEFGSFFSKNAVDLIFLDIEMPYLSGVSFLRSLKQKPAVVFTTAYDKYALEGYELEVVDYLLKPISFDRFFQASEKVKSFLNQQAHQSADYFFVKVAGRYERIEFNELLYVESEQNYIRLCTRTSNLLVHLPLKKVFEALPKPLFIQTHKSFLVNSDFVAALEGNTIQLATGHQIPISKHLRAQVVEGILKDKLLKRD